MTTSFDDFAKTLINDVEKFEKTVEVIDWIAEIAAKVIEQQLSNAELNEYQLRLSGLLSRLGTILADLNNYSNAAISYRKLKRVNEFCRFKQLIDSRTEKYFTDGLAGGEADRECREELINELNYLARYNKINILYEDTSRLIMSVQVYLKQEQKQMFTKNQA